MAVTAQTIGELEAKRVLVAGSLIIRGFQVEESGQTITCGLGLHSPITRNDFFFLNMLFI